ncbi:MAG: hypothetical protein M0C28_40415 [Candidatus Moduliflexus flocculans]|nr:hypothetical protein [Candidatus Moduliflexus flocculans]
MREVSRQRKVESELECCTRSLPSRPAAESVERRRSITAANETIAEAGANRRSVDAFPEGEPVPRALTGLRRGPFSGRRGPSPRGGGKSSLAII